MKHKLCSITDCFEVRSDIKCLEVVWFRISTTPRIHIHIWFMNYNSGYTFILTFENEDPETSIITIFDKKIIIFYA